MKDEKVRRQLAEMLSYGEEGRKAFKGLCVKFLPKETHDAIVEMVDNGMTGEDFLEKVNNDALDSYLKTKDKKAFDILDASEETRKEFLE